MTLRFRLVVGRAADIDVRRLADAGKAVSAALPDRGRSQTG
jgi:hypothetical protein